MRFVCSLLFLFIALYSVARADQGFSLNANTSAQITSTGITVSATGVEPFLPDIANFSISVTRTGGSAVAAQAALNAAWQKLLGTLQKTGITSDAIQPGLVSLQNGGQVIRTAPGWQAGQSLTARVPLDRAAAVADALNASGLKDEFTVSYDTSKRDELYQAALREAVAKGSQTAETLASAAHVEILKVQSIDAGPTPDLMHAYQGILSKLGSPGGVFGIFGAASQASFVSATVLMNYQIKP
jgi:uncharacterized protein YggE